MIQFFQTKMGVTFFEGTLPKLITSITRLAEAVEKASNLLRFDEGGSLKVNNVPSIVYVVRYSHRHGNDVWAKRTEEEAFGSIQDTMQQWMEDQFSEKPEVRAQLKEFLKNNDVHHAMEVWESNSDEFFEITQVDIDRPRADAQG